MIAGQTVGALIFSGMLLPALGMSQERAMLVALPAVCGASWAMARWSKTAAERLLVSLALPERPQAPTLIVRAPGDEAGAALASAQFSSWVVNFCWVRPALVAVQIAAVIRDWGARARRHRVMALTLVGLCIATGIVEYVWGPLGMIATPSLRRIVSAIWIGAFSIGAATLWIWILGFGAGLQGYLLGLVVVGMLMLPFILLLTILVAPFGPDLAVAAVSLEISAEPTPPGEWVVHQLGVSRSSVAADDRARLAAFELSHSTYDDPEAIKVVADWIQART